jgi:hypothetical protein
VAAGDRGKRTAGPAHGEVIRQPNINGVRNDAVICAGDDYVKYAVIRMDGVRVTNLAATAGQPRTRLNSKVVVSPFEADVEVASDEHGRLSRW